MSGVRNLTTEEVKMFDTNASDLRSRALFFLGWGTGMRISEMLSLTVKDVMTGDTVKERIVVTVKGGKRRSFIVPDKTKTEIKAYITRHPSVDSKLFLSREGTLSRNQAIRTVRAAICAAIGIVSVPFEIGTHTMRKTLARDVYESSGKDLVMVQKVLGHKYLTATHHYLQPSRKAVDDTIMNRKVS